MSTSSILHLGRADQGRKLTHDEFADAVYEEPWRYERVKGRLSVMSPSGDQHVRATQAFLKAFFVYWDAYLDRVERVVPEAWVRIDSKNDRIADIGVYLKTARPKPAIPEAVPELIVETASEGYTSLKRDYEEKREDYYRAGVREYLVVDRFEQRVTVFKRSRGRFAETLLGPEGAYSPPLLPSLKIELKPILVVPPIV